MPSSDRFPSYVPASRVGAPTVSIYPKDFKAKDVYEVDFEQRISAKPATERWFRSAENAISVVTSQRARLERTSDGLWVVGRFQESALEHIVQGIDSALSTVEAHYYPNDYRLDKTEWERWQGKREDIQRRAEGLKATEIKYMGPERRGE